MTAVNDAAAALDAADEDFAAAEYRKELAYGAYVVAIDAVEAAAVRRATARSVYYAASNAAGTLMLTVEARAAFDEAYAIIDAAESAFEAAEYAHDAATVWFNSSDGSPLAFAELDTAHATLAAAKATYKAAVTAYCAALDAAEALRRTP